MAIKPHKAISLAVLGICSFQLLLPFVLSLCVMLIRAGQQELVREHASNTAFFEQIRMKADDRQGLVSADNEVVYNGTLYDVKTVKKENGEYVILGVPDRNETNLKKLNTSLAEKSPQTQADHF